MLIPTVFPTGTSSVGIVAANTDDDIVNNIIKIKAIVPGQNRLLDFIGSSIELSLFSVLFPSLSKRFLLLRLSKALSLCLVSKKITTNEPSNIFLIWFFHARVFFA